MKYMAIVDATVVATAELHGSCIQLLFIFWSLRSLSLTSQGKFLLMNSQVWVCRWLGTTVARTAPWTSRSSKKRSCPWPHPSTVERILGRFFRIDPIFLTSNFQMFSAWNKQTWCKKHGTWVGVCKRQLLLRYALAIAIGFLTAWGKQDGDEQEKGRTSHKSESEIWHIYIYILWFLSNLSASSSWTVGCHDNMIMNGVWFQITDPSWSSEDSLGWGQPIGRRSGG